MSTPTDAVLFTALSLVLGIGCRHLLRGTRVPYTITLLLVGVLLGSIEHGTGDNLGRVGDGIRLWANMDPSLLLAVFLPSLLFESSFSMDVHQVKRCMAQMLLLSGPGVLISTFSLGFLLKLTFPYGWSWNVCLLLGGLLSATDPVAVVALLKDLGASKKLSSIIEGESLMNDGTAIVIYTLFFNMVRGKTFRLGSASMFLARASFGAVGCGMAFGAVCISWLGFIFNDTVAGISLTLTASYLTYLTAQEGLDSSGVLAVMTLGMFFAAAARTAFKSESRKSLLHFWEMVSYVANTLIFILSGVIIAGGVFRSDHSGNGGKNWAFLFLLYIYVQASRIAVVALLYPFLRYFGYGLDWKESVILVWSGLRGAVALSLSLSVSQSSDGSRRHLSPDTGILFVFFTGGIVFFTLVVNGSTTQFLLRFLQMGGLSGSKKRVLDYPKHEMRRRALDAFSGPEDDEELGPADWQTVQRYITVFRHPHAGFENRNSGLPDAVLNLEDARIRLLKGVQSSYWMMVDEGSITRVAANVLMRSVDEALDLVSQGPLCDWNGLTSHVRFRSFRRGFPIFGFSQSLLMRFMAGRLESACCFCAAFLRAHRTARLRLRDFVVGESGILSTVIGESETEGEEPRRILEDIREVFPQVLRAVRTRQATLSSLDRLSEYVENLEKLGFLEKEEALHLHDLVQSDMKNVSRDPPPVKHPKRSDLIRVHHSLFGALPSMTRDLIERSSSEIVESRGSVLYEEGSNPRRIFLLHSGLVRWKSGSLNAPDPVIPSGTALGLYEVLSEKGYTCDMIAESLVQCSVVVVNKKIVNGLLGSDPKVEELLWQECATVILRMLVPRLFGKMTMQELRAFIQGSTMAALSSGETVHLPDHTVAFLLEGYLRPFDYDDKGGGDDPGQQPRQRTIIGSPAALFPASEDLQLDNSKCFRGSSFSVHSRARIMIVGLDVLMTVRSEVMRHGVRRSFMEDVARADLISSSGGGGEGGLSPANSFIDDLLPPLLLS